MRNLSDYADRYVNARLERGENGVLEVHLHTKGGSLVWSESAHRELPLLFADIAADPGNRVVILTGSGEDFCKDVDAAIWQDMNPFAFWDKLYVEGKRLLMNLLNIEVPIIAAIHGEASIHAEIPAISDIVLASDTATFSDPKHFSDGLVPGDGVHVIWPMLLGPNRSRYFLLTGEVIAAEEARRLGFVQEIWPADELLGRARTLAAGLAEKPMAALRGARVLTTRRIQRNLLDDLGYGLMLESHSDLANRLSGRDWTGREHRKPAGDD